MSNFKSQAKRKRELAKVDKRRAKDQKRALRRAERPGAVAGAAAATSAGVAQAMSPQPRIAVNVPAVRKPVSLAEAAQGWMNMRVEKPKKR